MGCTCDKMRKLANSRSLSSAPAPTPTILHAVPHRNHPTDLSKLKASSRGTWESLDRRLDRVDHSMIAQYSVISRSIHPTCSFPSLQPKAKAKQSRIPLSCHAQVEGHRTHHCNCVGSHVDSEQLVGDGGLPILGHLLGHLHRT